MVLTWGIGDQPLQTAASSGVLVLRAGNTQAELREQNRIRQPEAVLRCRGGNARAAYLRGARLCCGTRLPT